MTESAECKAVCKIEVLDASKVDRDSNELSSAIMLLRVLSMASCCEARPGRDEAVWLRVCARWECNALPRLCNRMSFSGFGGTGGAGTLGVEDGIGRVRGASRRLGCGCLGCWWG